MIGCDGCDEWYHGECVQMDQTKAKLIVQFKCPKCGSQSVWKRKCRLPGCFREVAGPESKYCCDEHGVQYFDMIIKGHLAGVGPEALGEIVGHTKTLSDFKDLGIKPAVASANDTNTDMSSAQNGDKDQAFDPTSSSFELRQQYLTIAKAHAKTQSAELGDKRDVCGYDERLGDYDLHISAEEFENADYLAHICLTERKKCQRHQGWANIVLDELNLALEMQTADTLSAADSSREDLSKLPRPAFACGHTELLA